MARNTLVDAYKINGKWSGMGEDYRCEDLRMHGGNSDDSSFSQSRTSNLESCFEYSDQIYDKSSFIHDFNAPLIKTRLAINYTGDDADVPLLNGADGFGIVPFEGTDHCREPMPSTNSSAWKKLAAATSMCLFFMIIELVGGYIAGSLAVMTDAGHLLSDCVGFLVSLFAVWVAGQPPTNKFSYGYHRAEVLGALLSILVIWVLTGVFVYLAVGRLLRTEFEIHADAMMIVAAIGIGINIVMGCILHGGFHSHSHCHEENINVKAAVVHVLGDLIQSMGVFISAVVIKFYPNAKVVDPVCTFLCCILVIISTVPVLRESVWVLLETVPRHLEIGQLQSALVSLDGIDSVHSLHVWALTPGQYVLTAHLCVSALTDRDVVLEQAQRLLYNKYGLERTTLQVERNAAQVLAQ